MDYRTVMGILRQKLRARGFSSRGASFHARGPGGNLMLLSVQQSVRSTPLARSLIVNAGIRSARLDARLGEELPPRYDPMEAHWFCRPARDGREHWIEIGAGDTSESVASTLLDAIEALLPKLEKYSSDEALRDLWLSGVSPGLTDMQRLTFLAILLDDIGPREKVVDVLEEIERKFSGTVQGSVARANLRVAGLAPRSGAT